MFIHIGGETIVNLHRLIGIFDIHVEESPNTKEFIKNAKNSGAVEIVDQGDIKSCVVTDNKIYYSPISSVTLKKRAVAMDAHGKFEVD